MAPLALVPREEPPGLVPHAAGGRGVGDRKRQAATSGGHEVGVGARLVPGIGIAAPVAAVEMEQLRLELPLARRVARRHLHGKRFGEHGAGRIGELGRKHRTGDGGLGRMELHRTGAGEPDDPLRRGMIGPGLGRDLEGRHARHRLVLRRVGEKAGLREFFWKRARLGDRIARHEFVDRAVVVIEDEEFAVAVFGKCDHADRGGHEIDERPRSVARGGDAPHPACHPVAEDVAADKLGKLLPAIDDAAGDRRPGRVRHLAPWFHDRGRPLGPVAMDRVARLDEAPAVVVARLHATDEFPHFESDVAGPEFAGAAVKAHLPRIAVAEGIEFAAGAGHVHEWVVGRNRVAAAGSGVIDVDPQNRSPQVGDVLTSLVEVFGKMVSAVARRDVKHAVGAEGEAAAVVAAGRPGDHLDFAGRIGPRHAGVIDHGEPHHPRALGEGRPRFVAIADGVAEVAEAIGGEVGMEREMKDATRIESLLRGSLCVEPCDQISGVDERVGLAAVAVGWQRIGVAILLRDEATVAAGSEGERGGGRKSHMLVDPLRSQRRGRLRSAVDPRRCPWHGGRAGRGHQRLEHDGDDDHMTGYFHGEWLLPRVLPRCIGRPKRMTHRQRKLAQRAHFPHKSAAEPLPGPRRAWIRPKSRPQNGQCDASGVMIG